MIGVLDLQGGVAEHLAHLEHIGARRRRVKNPDDFHGLQGLIIPGGESTCIARLMKNFAIDRAIVRAYRRGMKIWGTCAGAILLAKSIVGESPHLDLIDIDIERNGFGSQLDSFVCEMPIPFVASDAIPLVFIRAPKIRRVGYDVKILLKIGDYIAAAETPGILVTVFHPELTEDLSFHRYFVRKCGHEQLDESPTTQDWKSKQWTRLARII
jgi:pyridoxal 5'-phosphate synthase pdxT subunit